ncbi:hypothetical protein [Campylobacter geochelonis]|uniref:Cytolethal distending toxin A/C family protein n=1 Tax=Campylobacter geochelonis TaxID=1780362 RepID=A0A128EK47_9BACT|nr:hypothetical protein [Campylobacter geochelonis]QKF71231.1 cytolethal distending toxin, subunit CdtC [Campylobacter geochelonis]CZE49157.1 cytolethal distending toxin A/C family protein [Campylobacter geochelonis]CZE49315.1 cytolethal distending toxin A/C family protein [Campylobacter geochelonis]CZE51423.1 cytolethal distending toxin A/C family protein [Campylobacter geochelonis]
MKIFIKLLLLVLLSIPSFSDENVMPLVSIRSLKSGILIAYEDNAKNLIDRNWRVKDIVLPYEIGKNYPFGAVQFVHPSMSNLCLALDGAKLTTMECSLINVGDFRTAFSLLPTATSAVQIKAINDLNECLSMGNSRTGTSFSRMGLRSCETDEKSDIILENLFVLSVPILDSKLVK